MEWECCFPSSHFQGALKNKAIFLPYQTLHNSYFSVNHSAKQHRSPLKVNISQQALQNCTDWQQQALWPFRKLLYSTRYRIYRAISFAVPLTRAYYIIWHVTYWIPTKCLGASLGLLGELDFRLRETPWYCGSEGRIYRTAEAPSTSSSAPTGLKKTLSTRFSLYSSTSCERFTMLNTAEQSRTDKTSNLLFQPAS